jgi:hypothetical protein
LQKLFAECNTKLNASSCSKGYRFTKCRVCSIWKKVEANARGRRKGRRKGRRRGRGEGGYMMDLSV